MPDILFKCLKCAQGLAVEGDAAGTAIECANCGAQIVVPAPAVEWECPACAAVLSAPSTLEGESVNCPSCEAQSVVPKGRPRLRLASKCSSCGAPMPDNAVICIACGHDRRTGRQVGNALAPHANPVHSRASPVAAQRRPIFSPGLIAIVVVVSGIAAYLLWWKPVEARNDAFVATMRQATEGGASESALNALRQFIAKYPHGCQSALAQAQASVFSSQFVASTYATALQQADGAGTPREALRVLETAVRKYPESPQADAARERMAHAREAIQHDDEMGKAISSAQALVSRKALAEAKSRLELAILASPTASSVAKARGLLAEVDTQIRTNEVAKTDKEANDLLKTAAANAAQGDSAGSASCCRKAAALGNARARNLLGMFLWADDNATQKCAEAFALFRDAADQGWDEAQKNVGMCRLVGRGCDKDVADAVRWFRKAADKGNAEAMGWMGFCLLTGQGVSCDAAEAAKWYGKSVESGCAAANRAMGALYLDGRGVPRNVQTARECFSMCARQGDVLSQKCLACCSGGFLSGEAAGWAAKAAAQGDHEANAWLASWRPAVWNYFKSFNIYLGLGSRPTRQNMHRNYDYAKEVEQWQAERDRRTDALQFPAVFPSRPSDTERAFVPSDGFVFPWGISKNKQEIEWKAHKCPVCGGTGASYERHDAPAHEPIPEGLIGRLSLNDIFTCYCCKGTGLRPQ